MESIRQSYVNTVNELNQELLVIKEQCEQLDAEKEFLNRELEKRSADANQERVQQTIGKFLSSYGIEKWNLFVLEKIPSDLFKQPFKEVCFVLSCIISHFVLLLSRFLFMPVVLALTKMQKNFDNYERTLLFSRLNMLNLMKLTELGNYFSTRNSIISEANFMTMYQSMIVSHLIKRHNRSLIKSLKKGRVLPNNIMD
jgi:hypothetical protein